MLKSLKSKALAIGGLTVALAVVSKENAVQNIMKSPEVCTRDAEGMLVSSKDGKSFAYMNRLETVVARGGELTTNANGQLIAASAGDIIENNDLREINAWELGKVSSLFSSVMACKHSETGDAVRFVKNLPAGASIEPRKQNPGVQFNF